MIRWLLHLRKYVVLLNFGNIWCYTFQFVFSPLNCYVCRIYWTEVIQGCTRSINKNLTDDQVNVMDWLTKVKYLQQNPVLAARQNDYILWVV